MIDITEFAEAVLKRGGRAYAVGGWVRDRIMGIESKDLDIEVYGLSQEVLEDVIASFGVKPDLVGKSFGVYKLGETDISLPRTEKKSGTGHKGFTIVPDPFLTPEKAVLRRDLTVNAILYDPLTQGYLDPCGGVTDIESGTLRYVDEDTFTEDPLRVYRVMQFIGRFEFTPAPELVALCRKMVWSGEMDTLPKERVFEEFNKLLIRGKKPSLGLEFLREIGAIEMYFTELYQMIGVEQEPDWHAEGDVWKHTMLVVDAGVEGRAISHPSAFMFACLCHDMGKPDTAEVIDGRITTRRHDEYGEIKARFFMANLTTSVQLTEQVAFLVRNHLLVANWAASWPIRKSTAAKLARKLESLGLNHHHIVAITLADNRGRVCLTNLCEENKQRVENFAELMSTVVIEVGKEVRQGIKPLVTGNDLISMGLKPGPLFRELLEDTLNFQIDNNVTDKSVAIAHVREVLDSRNIISNP